MNFQTINVENYKYNDMPTYFDVEAVCVGGVDGVRAYFIHPNRPELIVFADGDDGHWWVNNTIHRHWIPGLIMAMQTVIS